MPLGERRVQPVRSRRRGSGSARATLRAIASCAAGNGPNGPSFDASLTTRSSPSSRWTSSTGFPGWYGVRRADAGPEEGVAGPPGPLPSERVAIGQTLASARRAGAARRHRPRGQVPGQSLGPGRASPVPAGLRRLQAWRSSGSFPLPLVLVPTERIPLHIFEPRYLELIERVPRDGRRVRARARHRRRRRARDRDARPVQQVLETLDDGTHEHRRRGRRALPAARADQAAARSRPASSSRGRRRRAARRRRRERALELFRELADGGRERRRHPRRSTRRTSSSSSRRASTSASSRSRSCSRRPRRRARDASG